MTDISEQKNILRSRVKNSVISLDESLRRLKSHTICEKLLSLKQIQNANSVLLYSALFREVNLDEVISALLECKKRVYLPRISGDAIELVNVSVGYKTVTGGFGISEPIGEADANAVIDVIVTPLVAVDRRLNRLGNGKGYYDRLFVKKSDAYKIGVAFLEQVVASVPTDERDVKLDLLITD